MTNSLLLSECLDEFKTQNELTALSDSDVFELFTSLQITKESDTSYDEISESIVDGGQDGGIDTFLILINDKAISHTDQLQDIKFKDNTEVVVYIGQSKYENSFKEDPINRLQSSIPLILDLSLTATQLTSRFNTKLIEKIILFRSIWRLCVRKHSNLEINYVYACKANEICISPSLKSKIDQLVAYTQHTMSLSTVSFTPYSAKELIHLYTITASEELELTFKETPIPVPFNNLEYGYLGIITLNDYYKFITEENGTIREKMFENNIRHYQGEVDVNTNISNTLVTNMENDFWWLNNGITIIASECHPILKTLFLSDPQIVNGLQTSYTINKSFIPNPADTRSILVKVIVSKAKKTIDRIISASNSQNAVPPILLRATDDIQRDIETFCLTKGYFYDRRKNYYKNHHKPANKIISIQNMAQAIEAILNYSPANARSKPTTLIKADISYRKIFNPEIDFNAFLTCSLIHKKTVASIRSFSSDSDKNIANNFTYHLSRIITSLLLSKAKYTPEDVVTISIDTLNESTIISAYDILSSILISYLKKYPNENIINISKSNKFVQLLNSHLDSMFPASSN